MVTFVAGLVIFFGSHFAGAIFRDARTRLIRRLGEGGYKGLYSVISLIGLVLVVRGWPEASRAVLYAPPLWLQSVTYLFTAIAFVLLWAAYLPAGRIKAATKHPMLAGVKLWAFGHLLANGDVRSVLLFGSFLVFGVVDRIIVKRRGEEGPSPGPARWDAVALAGGLAGTVVTIVYLHPWLGGVPLYPGAIWAAVTGG